MLVTVWEIIWTLTGGLLLSILIVGVGFMLVCALPIGGCYYWMRRRKSRSKLTR